MTCKDCIHYDVCTIIEMQGDDEDYYTEFGCDNFMSKLQNNCHVCNSDYDQVISAYPTRVYSSSDSSTKPIAVKYCPACGRKLWQK